MDFTIATVEGINAVIKRLEGFDKKVRRKLERRGIRAAGKPVLAAAKRLAPIADQYQVHDAEHQPGMLQKSLRMRALKSTASRRRAGLYGVRIQAGKESHMFKGETFYGGFVEFGTVYQDPQGFMNLAANENQGVSKAIFVTEITKYINEEGSKRG